MVYLKLHDSNLFYQKLKKNKLATEFLSVPFAHRGYHDCNELFGSRRTENSLASILAAIDGGFGIEIDIQLSKDGIPMVFHDYNLGRLTGYNLKLRELSSNELSNIFLSNGEIIPTLRDALDLVRGRSPILIELKDHNGLLSPQVGLLENQVANILKDYNGPVAIMSFNPYSVNAFGLIMPEVPRGLVVENFRSRNWPNIPKNYIKILNNLSYSLPLGLSFISYNYDDYKKSQNTFYHSLDIYNFCWTIRSKSEADDALKTFCNITFEGFDPNIGKNIN